MISLGSCAGLDETVEMFRAQVFGTVTIVSNLMMMLITIMMMMMMMMMMMRGLKYICLPRNLYIAGATLGLALIIR